MKRRILLVKNTICILLAYPLITYGACPAYIQSRSSNASTFTNTLAFNTNITAGSLIVVGCNSQVFGNTILVSDNNGGIYSTATVIATGGSGEVGVYYAPNHPAGATSVTCADITSAATYIQQSIHEYSGAALVNPLDVFSSSAIVVAITTTTANSLYATTTGNNELMFNMQVGGGSPVAENGTLRENFVFNQFENTQDTCLTTPQVYNSSFTFASTTYSGGSIQAAFVPPSTASPSHTFLSIGGGTLKINGGQLTVR